MARCRYKVRAKISQGREREYQFNIIPSKIAASLNLQFNGRDSLSCQLTTECREMIGETDSYEGGCKDGQAKLWAEKPGY